MRSEDQGEKGDGEETETEMATATATDEARRELSQVLSPIENNSGGDSLLGAARRRGGSKRRRKETLGLLKSPPFRRRVRRGSVEKAED